MVLRNLMIEDFVNYRLPSMFLIFPFCTFKCGRSNCQNAKLVDDPKLLVVTAEEVCKQFVSNGITKAIVCGGLEPFDSVDDLIELIDTLRNKFYCQNDVVIYTGYTEEEINSDEKKKKVLEYSNIVVKYGRYVPNETPHRDSILGVNLASSNQYAKRYN